MIQDQTVQLFAFSVHLFLKFCSCEFFNFSCFHNPLHILSWVIITSYDELSLDWQFLSSQAQSFFSHFIRYAIHFDEHTTGCNRCYESFRITFTFTHTYIGRFTGYRFIGEDADPDLSLTLHVTCYSYTRSLYLLACNPDCSQRFDAKRAESQLITALGYPLRMSILLSSVFCLFRL